MTISEQVPGISLAADLDLAFPDVPGFTGQGWSTQETMMVVRWLFANPAAWARAMATARQYPGNPHTVADTLHEKLVPRSELDAIAAAGGDPAKVNWLEIGHELIERRHDPLPDTPQEHAGITAQAVDLAAGVAVAPEAMRDPGLPVPDDSTDISMFTAHRADDILRQLAHAAERMQAARATPEPALRAYRSGHIRRHLGNALDAAHWLVLNIREHYPAEAAELEQVKRNVGLARSLTPQIRAATTAHLLETTLHEMTHGARHAEAMLHPDPAEVWEFNAQHAEKHLKGAVEHASKLAGHFRDNYPQVAKWLEELDEITSHEEEGGGGKQHARYSKRETALAGITAQALGVAATISAQVDLAEVNVRPFRRVVRTPDGPRTEIVRGHTEQRNWIPQPKWQAGQKEWEQRGEAARAAEEAAEPAPAAVPWAQDGDVMRYHGSLGVDRKDMPQVSGLLADGRYAPSSEMMPKFLDHLKAKGVGVTRERVPARTLKPVQTTGDMRAVRGIAGSLASGDLKDTKPVLVSSDNRVVDGHHQWAAHLLGESGGTRTGSAPGEPAIRADLPAGRLMDEARQFAKDQGIQNRETGVAANPRYARPEPVSAQAAPKGTLEKYTRPDGTLTPERAALHQRIIGAILAGHKPQEHPAATFFGGGPAAGKSTALKATHPDSAHIDPDEIKAQLPEYQQMLDAKDPRAAAYVHEESSQIAKQATREAQKQRLNFTLDGTGDSDVAKLAGKVNDAKKHGYMTEGKYVTAGTDEAVRRAKARAAATGRHVPETFVRETHAAVSDTYAKAAKMGLFDKTELWDTSGTAPALVAHKEPGGQFTVDNPAAWQRFLDKAKEGKP